MPLVKFTSCLVSINRRSKLAWVSIAQPESGYNGPLYEVIYTVFLKDITMEDGSACVNFHLSSDYKSLFKFFLDDYL